MKKIVVDANAILRFFLNDIPKQKIAFEKLLYQAKDSKILLIIPQIIIFELQFILDKYYHFSKADVINRLKVLVSTDYLEIESRKQLITALTIYSSSAIDFVDCFLAAVAQSREADIFTFDQRLKKLIK